MKALAALCLLLTALFARAPALALNVCAFNFRSTLGYVTDTAPENFIGAGALSLGFSYPQTGNGCTFGWSSSTSTFAEDQNASGDRRLAGDMYVSNNFGAIQPAFKVDLTPLGGAGIYTVTIAAGSYSYTVPHEYLYVYDDTTLLWTVANDVNVDAAVNWFLDAVGTAYSGATWPTLNTTKTLTFSSTSLIVKFGAGTTGGPIGYSHLNHLRVEGAARCDHAHGDADCPAGMVCLPQ